MMSGSRTSTPTRVRTPVRSSSATARPTSAAAAPRASAPAARVASPRTAIASSPVTRRVSSPVTKVAPPPPTISAIRASQNASASSRNVSPASRTVSPLKTAHAPIATPNARAGSRSGIVSSPRVGTTSSGIRGDSPVRRTSNAGLVASLDRAPSPHTRETSAAQKAQLKKDHEEMTARVNQIMAINKPTAINNYFRVDLSRESDVRMSQIERIRVDPELNPGAKRVSCAQRSTALVSHMSGIMTSTPLGTPRNRPDLGDVPIKGRTHYSAASKSNDVVVGSRMARADELAASARRESESARRLRATSASDNAPWNKASDFTPTNRAHSASRSIRAPSPISFDPKAPINVVAPRAQSAHRHHDTFTDKPNIDKRGLVVESPRISGHKPAETIRREMATQPPPELPPRKKPSIKASPMSSVVNDIFKSPYADAGACSAARLTVGKRSVSARREASISNPNEICSRGEVSLISSRRHLTPTHTSALLVGAAGIRSDERALSPEHTRRRPTPQRNASSLGVGEEGMTSSRDRLTTTPTRRQVLTSRVASTSANAPFGTDSNEYAGSSRHGDSTSPQRYSSPVDKARGSRNPGFYSQPAGSMKSVFNWE